MPKDWALLVHCWRGGKALRYADLAVARIDSMPGSLPAAKTFRARVNAELPQLAQHFRYVTICSCTGTSKTAAGCGDRCRGTGG